MTLLTPPRRSALARGRRERLSRLLRLRLLIPILRSRHEPEHTARGVFVGLFLALTPTVGVQMLLVAAVWLAAQRLHRRWHFNLVVALAWTWVTNVLTVPPVYYIFLLTGRVVLGHWSALPDFDVFASKLETVLQTDADWLTSLWYVVWRIFELWGLPMLLGSLPWAVLGAALGYHWSLRLVRRLRLRRAMRAGPQGGPVGGS